MAEEFSDYSIFTPFCSH